MKVSFIGLGKMGLAMSDRLLGGGHTLTVYNRTATKGSDLVSRGAKLAASIAEAAKASDVVITMLENDGALASVAFDKGGLVESLGKDAIHVSMGTHSTGLIRKLTEAHAKAGQILVGAPVMGRPPAAAAGQLGILAGGPASAIEKCQPLFAAMGRRTFDAGKEPVAAASAKISVNLVLACAIEAMGEGFALAEKCGLPGPAFLEILTDGLFAAPAYKIYGKIIAEKGYFGDPGFSATTGLKDINLALAASEGVGVPTPALNVSRDRLLGAIANGHGDRDWSVMALEQARASGIE